MITKEQWDAIYREEIADGQKRLGPPPTFEEVEALSRGELSDAEAQRVRELLSYYPDLLRVFTEPLPANAEGVLTDEELASDLSRIRSRLRDGQVSVRKTARKDPAWRMLAIAAGVVIAVTLGSIGVWRKTTQQRPLLTVFVYPEASRGIDARGLPGVTPARISTNADYVLNPVFESRRQYREYRIELLDLTTEPPKRLWLRDHVARQPDSTYPVRLSTKDLEPGLYRLVLYGVDEAVEELAEYTLRLKAD